MKYLISVYKPAPLPLPFNLRINNGNYSELRLNLFSVHHRLFMFHFSLWYQLQARKLVHVNSDLSQHQKRVNDAGMPKLQNVARHCSNSLLRLLVQLCKITALTSTALMLGHCHRSLHNDVNIFMLIMGAFWVWYHLRKLKAAPNESRLTNYHSLVLLISNN